ncbi:hypothetical protein [Candidatus Amarolinea aalborgensis]|uniref:hypothetical protein n=1 Tax=Candidatus Amarolinea aalborgensis TaxID=2249329 RepID=UPI003BFA207F
MRSPTSTGRALTHPSGGGTITIKTGCLVTLNRRHFIEDPEVARRSGLRIETPGDALAWVRGEIG